VNRYSALGEALVQPAPDGPEDGKATLTTDVVEEVRREPFKHQLVARLEVPRVAASELVAGDRFIAHPNLTYGLSIVRTTARAGPVTGAVSPPANGEQAE
jgi:hypothetical protein